MLSHDCCFFLWCLRTEGGVGRGNKEIAGKLPIIKKRKLSDFFSSLLLLWKLHTISPKDFFFQLLVLNFFLHEERRWDNQLDERPKRGVTWGDGAMRGGGAGRWEAAVWWKSFLVNTPNLGLAKNSTFTMSVTLYFYLFCRMLTKKLVI